MFNGIGGAGFYAGTALNAFIYVWSGGLSVNHFIDFCRTHFDTLGISGAQIIVYANGTSNFFTFPFLDVSHSKHLRAFHLSTLYKSFGLILRYMRTFNSALAYVYVCKVANDRMGVKQLHFWNMLEVNTLNGDGLSRHGRGAHYNSRIS